MCRPKELGGRRCPQHTDPVKHAAYNAHRRETYAAKKVAVQVLSPTPAADYNFPDFSEVRYSATYRDTPTFNKHVKEVSAFEKNLGAALRKYENKLDNASTLTEEETLEIERLADEASIQEEQTVAALKNYTLAGYDETRRYFNDSIDVYGEPFTEEYKKSFEEKVQALDNCFKYAPKLKDPRLVYRGIRIPDNESTSAWVKEKFPVGEVISQKNYMSTTRDPYLALTTFSEKTDDEIDEDELDVYGDDRESVIFEIMTKQGVPLGERTSSYSEEVEILMPREAKFKVVSVHFAQSIEAKLFAKDEFPRKEKRTVVRLVDVSE